MTLTNYIAHCQTKVNQALKAYICDQSDVPATLQQAMQYVALAEGKRIRPILVYASAQLFTSSSSALITTGACSVELIHAYSLVHDDLPAMDDDDLRRGQPTCHKAFDEATAILTGDALQSLAFEILAKPAADKQATTQQLAMLNALAKAIGRTGMIAGQVLDLSASHQSISLEALNHLHQCKTGALIRASIHLGCLAAGVTDNLVIKKLDDYARNIGLAFQIQDDILDVIGNTEQLGKHIAMDDRHGKSTYPALLGLERATAKVQTLHERALSSIASFGKKADRLREISEFIINRQY